MISISNIHKSYGELKVLKGVNLEIAAGEIISITGASGAGKSTLLHVIGTLDKADSGSVMYDLKDVQRLTGNALARFRNRHIGFIFQFHHLLPEFDALENVCIPAFIGGVSKSTALQKARELLKVLGLDNRMHHKPAALSGGEQQRVAVARALINQPQVILADEPSGNLDSINARELHALFLRLREHYRQTFIIVTHNSELAQMADRQLVMKDGVIV
jgi:lipoprotein-releasing system ATP-binding protein